jgi:hypothetical protein
LQGITLLELLVMNLLPAKTWSSRNNPLIKLHLITVMVHTKWRKRVELNEELGSELINIVRLLTICNSKLHTEEQSGKTYPTEKDMHNNTGLMPNSHLRRPPHAPICPMHLPHLNPVLRRTHSHHLQHQL